MTTYEQKRERDDQSGCNNLDDDWKQIIEEALAAMFEKRKTKEPHEENTNR